MTLRIVRRNAVLVGAAWGLLVVGATLATAADAAKPALRGMSWDSIKQMPDWSGMWTPGPPPAGVAQPARPANVAPAGGLPGAAAPRGFGANVPFTPKYRAIADARMVRVLGQGSEGVKDIPLSNSGFCIPSGVPQNMMQVSHEYVFQPGRVILLLENSEIRRVWTDGRGHPPDDESNPDFQGHSIGHWEGDTLVVETKQIYPEAELFFGMTVTENTVMRERISLVNRDTMKIDTVVEDEELFTKPWTYTRYYRRENRESVPYERCTLADRAQKVGDKLIGIDFDVNTPKPGDKK
jgi:hypothetical protein